MRDYCFYEVRSWVFTSSLPESHLGEAPLTPMLGPSQASHRPHTSQCSVAGSPSFFRCAEFTKTVWPQKPLRLRNQDPRRRNWGRGAKQRKPRGCGRERNLLPLSLVKIFLAQSPEFQHNNYPSTWLPLLWRLDAQRWYPFLKRCCKHDDEIVVTHAKVNVHVMTCESNPTPVPDVDWEPHTHHHQCPSVRTYPSTPLVPGTVGVSSTLVACGFTSSACTPLPCTSGMYLTLGPIH